MNVLLGKMPVLACAALLCAGSAHAGDPVQWRVEDGGNGHWYEYVHDMTIGWQTAVDAAAGAGGHLASITSADENVFVFAYLDSVSAWVDVRGPFLGGYQDLSASDYAEPSGGWRWVTGEPWALENWSTYGFGEPNNDFGVEHALAMDKRFGGIVWNDVALNGHAGGQSSAYRTSTGYLIEWSADCNNDGLVDFGQIRSGQLADINANNIPDICEAIADCNNDGVTDADQIASGQLADANANGVPDVCEAGFAATALISGAAPAVPLRDVDLGEGIAIGIRADGTLTAWGYPVKPPTGSFVEVSAGRQCAIGIRTDGTLAPFGLNEYGRLDVPSGTFKRISAADATWHAAGIRSDGTVACWGFNNHGQANAPSGTFREIAAGGHNGWSGFTIAIRTNGAITAWGNNTWGQLAVPSGSNFRKIAAGYYHALAVRNDNTLAGWGWNGSGQSSVPSGQFVDVSCGSTESIALRADGTVVVFGSVPDSLINFFATRPDVTKAQIFCCGGAIALESKDCDGNGDFDAVEIAQNPSLDADINGVLDLCESTILVPSQYPTIQAAIDSVPMGVAKVVQVAAGTHNQSFSLNGKDVVVRGAPDYATIIDGIGLTSSIAQFTGGEPATAGIENLVLRNGTVGALIYPGAPFRVGGGLYATNSSAFVRNCRFESNASNFGGGAYLRRSAVLVEGCEFVGNTASAESGGLQLFESSGTVVDTVFIGNTAAPFGAGAASAFKAVGAGSAGGIVALTGCLIESGSGNGDTTAVEMFENFGSVRGTLVVSDTVITGNIGGGIRVIGSPQACILADGAVVCGNFPRNMFGSYLIEGKAEVCDCLADLTLDGAVNGADLGVVLAAWGAASSSGAGDVNHDGLVDGADLAGVLAAWGPCQ
jgi:hypothetical protein